MIIEGFEVTRKNVGSFGLKIVRQYYGSQNPVWCAITGHKMSGILLTNGDSECLRCGGKWSMFSEPPGLYQWLVLRPIAPIRIWISVWRYRRWHRRFFK